MTPNQTQGPSQLVWMVKMSFAAAKWRHSIAHGGAERNLKSSATQRNPGYRTAVDRVALKGRDSVLRRLISISHAAVAPGMTPFQGYGVSSLHVTQGCTLGYGITHLRCYGVLTAENDS